MVVAIVVSLVDRNPKVYIADEDEEQNTPKTSSKVKMAWVMLTVVMICLYLYFNGH